MPSRNCTEDKDTQRDWHMVAPATTATPRAEPGLESKAEIGHGLASRPEAFIESPRLEVRDLGAEPGVAASQLSSERESGLHQLCGNAAPASRGGHTHFVDIEIA